MTLKDIGRADRIRPNAYSQKPETTLFGPRGTPVEDSTELQRVLDIPRRPSIDPESLEARVIVQRETARYALDRTGMGPCRCRELSPPPDGDPSKVTCITTLLPIQAIALREMRLAQGFWGSIVVGLGKGMLNVLGLLALDDDVSLGLLLVPANLMKQFKEQYRLYSQHFRVPKAVIHLPQGDWTEDSPTGEAKTLHVMSHNAISSPRQSDFIDRIQPHALIIDESDGFSALQSARGIRLTRYMQEHPNTKCLFWTGSPCDKAIEEMAHLIAFALKDKAPVPLLTTVVEDWGRCINVVNVPAPAGALMQLVGPEDEGDTEQELVRSAFRRRLEETQGIIMTESADVYIEGSDKAVAVEVLEREVSGIPQVIQDALKMVREGERPDTMAGSDYNETFADPMEQIRCAREVACGMFYYFDFPNRERRDVIDRWFEVRKAFNSEVREQINKAQKFLDSPHLCEVAAMRHHGDLPVDPRRPTWKSRMWPEWREVKDTVHPVSKAWRLSDYLVRDAIDWATTHTGVVWYSNAELARWMSELSGLPVFGGGPDAEDRIMTHLRKPGKIGSIVASMNSHGRGRDGLQDRYSEQLILNVPSSSRRNQQLYARLHRRRQRAEVVRSWVYTHTRELKQAHKQALARADFVEAILKQKQKIKMGGDWVPDPTQEDG